MSDVPKSLNHTRFGVLCTKPLAQEVALGVFLASFLLYKSLCGKKESDISSADAVAEVSLQDTEKAGESDEPVTKASESDDPSTKADKTEELPEVLQISDDRLCEIEPDLRYFIGKDFNSLNSNERNDLYFLYTKWKGVQTGEIARPENVTAEEASVLLEKLRILWSIKEVRSKPNVLPGRLIMY